MNTSLVPFGKYKDQPIAMLAADRDYCDWLTAQAWFVQRYPAIHTLVINNFGQPDETPEHNALQILLLDDTFRARVAAITLAYFHANCTEGVSSFMAELSLPVFEWCAIDVRFSIIPWRITHARQEETTATEYVHTWAEPHEYWREIITIECKPSLGDEYPTVLRQINAARQRIRIPHHAVLLVRHLASQSVSPVAIRQFFALSQILLLDVETVLQHPLVRIYARADLPSAQEIYRLAGGDLGDECKRHGCVPF